MLDKKTEMMLSVASLLTAEDLDQIRATAPTTVTDVEADVSDTTDIDVPTLESVASAAEPDPSDHAGAGTTRGERERLRTRESKIATACVGQHRQKHDWWTVGTELTGRIGSETFTAVVVENPQVKSGRSIRITSGPASGKVCRTPSRAALEATEAYRQANNLGRGGGVTNGWAFWKPNA